MMKKDVNFCLFFQDFEKLTSYFSVMKYLGVMLLNRTVALGWPMSKTLSFLMGYMLMQMNY